MTGIYSYRLNTDQSCETCRKTNFNSCITNIFNIFFTQAAKCCYMLQPFLTIQNGNYTPHFVMHTQRVCPCIISVYIVALWRHVILLLKVCRFVDSKWHFTHTIHNLVHTVAQGRPSSCPPTLKPVPSFEHHSAAHCSNNQDRYELMKCFFGRTTYVLLIELVRLSFKWNNIEKVLFTIFIT